MFRLIRNVNLFQLKNQLNFIFNDIDLKIKLLNIRRFRNDITFNSFFINIDDVKHD